MFQNILSSHFLSLLSSQMYSSLPLYSTKYPWETFLEDLQDIQGSGCDTNLPSIENSIQIEDFFLTAFGMHF